MANYFIGNRTAEFQANAANTRYIVRSDEKVDGVDYGITLSGTLTGRSFFIDGYVEGAKAAIMAGQNTAPVEACRFEIGETGFLRSEKGSALVTSGENHEIHNAGVISGQTGIVASDAATIENEGQITATGMGISGRPDAHITNEGYIGGIHGIYLTGDGVEGAVIVNQGVISGQYSAMYLTNAGDRVTNSGNLLGDVWLSGGNDTFIFKGGKHSGLVDGGVGNDTFVISAAGTTLRESFGGGDDTVKSAISWTLADNFEDLLLVGNKHNRGVGNALENEITGNSGNNLLKGAGGADTIAGNRGNDKISGGEAADQFEFATGHGHDVILDFENDLDKLDLSGWKAITGINDLKSHHLDVLDNGVKIHAGDDWIVLRGVSKGELDAGDFLFG
jgi:Ca2+-binding RTX toxin-like protein